MSLFCPRRNHCAYVVQKNITCTMQDGVSTYVKAEYTTKCIWGQKCPVVMYVVQTKQQHATKETVLSHLKVQSELKMINYDLTFSKLKH